MLIGPKENPGGSDLCAASGGCCQTNANYSLQGQSDCPLCRAETAPLSKGNGAVELEIGSGVEAAFLVEVIVDRRMDGGEVL